MNIKKYQEFLLEFNNNIVFQKNDLTIKLCELLDPHNKDFITDDIIEQ